MASPAFLLHPLLTEFPFFRRVYSLRHLNVPVAVLYAIVAHTSAGMCWDLRGVNMHLVFDGKIWFWKGPAPWFFVTVPEEESDILQAISGAVTYGWGMIPVDARINETEWQTSLFPKDDRYIVPIKARVRKAENLGEGDNVTVRLHVRL